MKLKAIITAAGLALLSSAPAFAGEEHIEEALALVVREYSVMNDVAVRCHFPMLPSVKTAIITTLMTIPNVDIASMELRIDATANKAVTEDPCEPVDKKIYDATLEGFPDNIKLLKQAIAIDYD